MTAAVLRSGMSEKYQPPTEDDSDLPTAKALKLMKADLELVRYEGLDLGHLSKAS